MSEYPYYEFRAVDRPLTPREQAELRALSTRAEISAYRFSNVYHWGNFPHGQRGPERALTLPRPAGVPEDPWPTHM